MITLRHPVSAADIGSGYGATARWLANNHQLHVTALALSPRQAQWARLAPLPPTGSVDYQVADWRSVPCFDGFSAAASPSWPCPAFSSPTAPGRCAIRW